MRVVVQRVSAGRVVVGGETIGAIDAGLVCFVGIEAADTDDHLAWSAQKIAGLRVFEDDRGKMNLAPRDVHASILAVPNFTVAGDCTKGRRPSFDHAMHPDRAREMFSRFIELLCDTGVPVETGAFGAEMDVTLTSDGPITLVIERHG